MNICLETFGCRLNRAEALECEAQAIALGHRIVKTHAEADLFVVRGCSVTSRAQRESEQMVRHLKHRYPNKRIIMLGCLAEAQKGDFQTLLNAKAGAMPKRPGLPTPRFASAQTPERPNVPTRTARAYLKVQDGCAGSCAFCIVPKFRGGARSEDFDATIDKAQRFITAGYHEIVVTGCNLALFASGGKRLPDLVDALAALSPTCRIRLGSLEPWGCADEVVDAMAAHENVCRFLHIPVQSGSDRILKLMNRPYAVADVERIVRKAQELMPTIGIGCDLMTGFPGESDIEFTQTRNLLARLPFSRAHVFPFSKRPGTPAEKLTGHIPHQTRADRARILNGIAKESRARFAKKFSGQEVDVVIESHGDQPKGWTSERLWFEGPIRPTLVEKRLLRRKQLVRFVVKSVADDVLHGVPVIDGR